MSKLDYVKIQLAPVFYTEVEETIAVFSNTADQLSDEVLLLVKELIEPVVPVLRKQELVVTEAALIEALNET